MPPVLEPETLWLEQIKALKIRLGLTERVIPVYAQLPDGSEKVYMLKITRRGLVLV